VGIAGGLARTCLDRRWRRLIDDEAAASVAAWVCAVRPCQRGGQRGPMYARASAGCAHVACIFFPFPNPFIVSAAFCLLKYCPSLSVAVCGLALRLESQRWIPHITRKDLSVVPGASCAVDCFSGRWLGRRGRCDPPLHCPGICTSPRRPSMSIPPPSHREALCDAEVPPGFSELVSDFPIFVFYFHGFFWCGGSMAVVVDLVDVHPSGGGCGGCWVQVFVGRTGRGAMAAFVGWGGVLS
jgi:hypothetical protein